ncbi:hypothetical protein Csa_022734 [Cucumis sativus]|uniref:Uncharacterized protein n=1 Tax=Cucumis sativus TaxID=3659 RepID=A0A0A0LY95_CUCSA|nr:hypothetical protein Csa_022734 [Cucumis sativus]
MARLPRRRRAVAASVYLLCLVLATFLSFSTSFSGSPLSDWSQFTLPPIIACVSASLNTFEHQPSYQSPFG